MGKSEWRRCNEGSEENRKEEEISNAKTRKTHNGKEGTKESVRLSEELAFKKSKRMRSEQGRVKNEEAEPGKNCKKETKDGRAGEESEMEERLKAEGRTVKNGGWMGGRR